MNELNEDVRSSEESRLSTAELAERRPAPKRVIPEPEVPAPEEEAEGRAISVDRAAAQAPADERPRQIAESEEDSSPLFAEAEARNLRGEWDAIQIAFVDEPRRSVERADELVARAVQRLAEGFAQERSRLESQWGRGEEVSTEDLRVVLRRYRSFFGRLLSA
ncbi:MAG TPA: hypothetical protein VKE50_10380 [Thermoanaerobaculia bacterium]|nr:hypothetical protein [Thermoanaerobaculia bacterium]